MGEAAMRIGPDPRTDAQLEELRDDCIIMRAQLWATGATVHNVNNLIGLYRSSVMVLDAEPDPARRRLYLELMACAYGCLADYMRHGDYNKARKDNPLPRLESDDPRKGKR